jgi:hypothetical protein
VLILSERDQYPRAEHLELNSPSDHFSATSQQIEFSRKFVFIHIGKTGGTSLRSMLAATLGADFCSRPFLPKYMTDEDARNYDRYDLIAGHISRSDQSKFFSDRDVITTIREPIDRCLSFIHYLRSLPRNALDIIQQIHDLPLEYWMEMPTARQHISNTMVRQLGGHLLDEHLDLPDLLKRAKKTLLEAFWVGRQEAMDVDVVRLGRLLDRNIQPLRENETPGRPHQASEPPEVINRLYALNGYDLQLWRWAQDTLFQGSPSSS